METKTKYELLQDFAEEIKNSLEYLFSSEELYSNFKNKIDEILITFLDNPQDIEDEIEWNESSLISTDDKFPDDDFNFNFDDEK